MTNSATLHLPGQEPLEIPIITGSENEKALDISSLRAKSGYITLDPGFVNTGACSSSITYLDGEKGILRYRGYLIEELAQKSTFVEVAYLLIHGNLPDQSQLTEFSKKLSNHSMIHEDMRHFYDGFSSTAHPMVSLSTMVASLSAYYSEASGRASVKDLHINSARIMAKVRTIAAFSYKKSIGQPFVYPLDSLPYCANFLNMMFSVPAQPYEVDEDHVKAMDLLLILHADHEQNCSASTVRVVGSSQANVYASVASGILALWGPLHGGANQQVLDMLMQINEQGGDIDSFVKRAKDPNDSFRLMGFGHRVYKNYDPRAKIIKEHCDRILSKLGVQDPLLEIAKRLEERALSDSYFVERKLYPNIDFYSGIIYRAIGLPSNMFTVMFALGRIPGWIAQWKEMHEDSQTRIARPRQIYIGENARTYVPMNQR